MAEGGPKISGLVHPAPTLAGSPIVVEGEAGVAGAGVGAGHVGTQLLAVAVATFVYVCGGKGGKLECSASPHDIQSSQHTEPTVLITQKYSCTLVMVSQPNFQAFRHGVGDEIYVSPVKCGNVVLSTSGIYQCV